MSKKKCKLCDQEKKLCNSHIFPEFLYKPTYDESHSFISVSANPRLPTRPIQKGFREYLLCRDCEEQFNKYETYTADLLREIWEKKSSNRRTTIKDFDYDKLKLFGLSIIWRAHKSNLPTYKDTTLGPHGPKIKKMLQNENPGPPEKYCFTLLKLEGTEFNQRLITPPFRTRFPSKAEDLNCLYFVAFGFYWIFITSKQSHLIPDTHPFVGFQDELRIPTKKMNEEEFIEDMKSLIDPSVLN